MTMQETLRDIEALTNDATRIGRRLRSVMDKATNASPVYSMTKTSGGITGSRVENGALNSSKFEQELVEITQELDRLRKKVDPYVRLLDKREQRVMAELRLIEGLDCESIALREHYSLSGVYTVLRKAKRQMIFLSSKKCAMVCN